MATNISRSEEKIFMARCASHAAVKGLTADGNCDADHRNITKSGSITIKLKFTAALTEAINVILYPIFDAKLEITKSRDVIMSYSR